MIPFAKKYLLSENYFTANAAIQEKWKTKPDLKQKQLLQVVWLAKKY